MLLQPGRTGLTQSWIIGSVDSWRVNMLDRMLGSMVEADDYEYIG